MIDKLLNNTWRAHIPETFFIKDQCHLKCTVFNRQINQQVIHILQVKVREVPVKCVQKLNH